MDKDQFKKEYHGEWHEHEDKIYIIASSAKMAVGFARKAKLLPSKWVYVSSKNMLNGTRGRKVVIVDCRSKINDLDRLIETAHANESILMSETQYLQGVNTGKPEHNHE